LLETKHSGQGQVVDAAMTDGVSLMMSMAYGLKGLGYWSGQRGTNALDGSAHFYASYACADEKFISVAAIESRFYAELLRRCGLDDPAFDAQADSSNWPALKEKLGALFKTRTRAQWCELLEGSDACFAPVLDMDEAPRHPHNQARQTFVTLDGITQPAPAPRYSRTPAQIACPPARAGEHSAAILDDWGVAADDIAWLTAEGII
jgi:alpha-methylacyl-CoA racemase